MIEHELKDEEVSAAVHEAIKAYKGYVPTLESAIGALFLGKALGSKVLRLVHNDKTIRSYEKILKIRFEPQMKKTTDLSRKSYGYIIAEKLNAFSKLIRGEMSYPKRSYLKSFNPKMLLSSSDE